MVLRIICGLVGHKEKLYHLAERDYCLWCSRCGKDIKADDSQIWKFLEVGNIYQTNYNGFAKCIHVNKGFNRFADFETVTPFGDIGKGLGNPRTCKPEEIISWKRI